MQHHLDHVVDTQDGRLRSETNTTARTVSGADVPPVYSTASSLR